MINDHLSWWSMLTVHSLGRWPHDLVQWTGLPSSTPRILLTIGWLRKRGGTCGTWWWFLSMMIIVATSVGHLHPILIQIRPRSGRAPPDVDLVSGVDPHATTEPVHEQEVPVLIVSILIFCLWRKNPLNIIWPLPEVADLDSNEHFPRLFTWCWCI